MNKNFVTRVKCALVLIGLTLLGLGPMPVTSIIGLYIVVFRPQWFKLLIERIYSE